MTTPTPPLEDDLLAAIRRDWPRIAGECIDCWRIWTELSIEEGGLRKRPNRPAPYPGPRCTTHDREVKKKRKEDAKDAKLLATYGITADEYWEIYDLQGGRCIFQCRATGKTRRLAVDHDHGGKGSSRYVKRVGLMPPPQEMRKLVRGLICGPHNMLLAEIGDDPEVFESIARYLREKPAQAILNRGRSLPPGTSST